MEAALFQSRTEGNPILLRIPSIEVSYEREGRVERFTDLELSHRAFDGHIRSGKVDGTPTTEHPAYRAARNSSPANAWDLFNLSPISIVFGSWDSSRKAQQGRWPSAITGETVGILADQGKRFEVPMKGGARVDLIGMRSQLDGPTLETLAKTQETELSKKTFDKVMRTVKALKPGETASATTLGLGGIPPTLSELGSVSCSSIIRTQVLSFASLRQLRFGKGPEGNAALRAVLAALALSALVRSNAELYIRANCHLIEAGPTNTFIDLRDGNTEVLTLPDPSTANALLEAAINNAAEVAGLDWHGQVLAVTGNPAVFAGMADEEESGD
jgi:CRISPR-associated protein Csb1